MTKKIFILILSFFILTGCTAKDYVYNTYDHWKNGSKEVVVVESIVDEKTCSDDCSIQIEVFGEFQFAKICIEGECVRDEEGLNLKKIELETLKTETLDRLKQLNVIRDDLVNLQTDADKGCRKVVEDLTNMQVIEFSTRIASLMDKDLPDFPSDSVFYVNSAIAEIHIYAGIKKALYPKLTKDGYANLNCLLCKHFSDFLPLTIKTIEDTLEEEGVVDEQLKLLP